MCGRYIVAQLAAAERLFKLQRVTWELTASYNVAPTQSVPIVRVARDGAREGVMVRWGLIPYFTRGEPPRFSTINARIETLETAPSYREPWQRGQRCLQIASGFYEWHLDAQGRKAPYFVHLADQDVFAFAGLWERSRKVDGSVIESCVLITMPANAVLREVHNTGANPYRMPAILREEDHEAWLHGTRDQARSVLQPYAADLTVAYEVSPRVNSPDNNDAQLLEPVHAATGADPAR
jgi:putative SOS response-associated peptidase YedK